jgi:hypothetical protein
MFGIFAIIVFANDSAGHYIEKRNGAWFVNSKTMKGAKAIPNIIRALSELERVSGVPCEMFEIGWPDAAIIPIRRVG